MTLVIEPCLSLRLELSTDITVEADRPLLLKASKNFDDTKDDRVEMYLSREEAHKIVLFLQEQFK